MESGKPREIAEKMVEGRIRKWQEEVVAPEAALRHEPGPGRSSNCSPTPPRASASPVTIKASCASPLGEGVEKPTAATDFATEVAKLLGPGLAFNKALKGAAAFDARPRP
jgi:elongation factor Ts